ncbi:hypothetical protein [Flavisericum labens]|uniref:hypothetical protein n=1 Tax=Flavisericum labens TaxID=3377112 RepID=UPI00387ABA23
MLENLKTYLLYNNRFCGVEHSSKTGQDFIYATVLKKSKTSLDIEQSFQATSVEELAEKLKKKQAAFLVINDDNVLTKQVLGRLSDADKMVFNAFPNINLEHFYYEIISQKNTNFISICRKDYLNGLVKEYQTKGINIIDVSLGNLVVSSISSFVEQQTVFTSNAKVSFESRTISNIENHQDVETSSYNINGLEVESNYVLSLSSALIMALQHIHPITNFDALKIDLKQHFNQSRYVAQFSKIGLVLILGILLVNFFVFNHYYNAVSTLQQTSQVNQATKQTLLKLDEEVNKSQKMVEDMLKSSISKSSFYINAIMLSLPKSVLLSELDYQPLAKNIKKDKPVELKPNTIIIAGESNDSEAFSKWLVELETMDWVGSVEILNYGDASQQISNFSLTINMNDDD